VSDCADDEGQWTGTYRRERVVMRVVKRRVEDVVGESGMSEALMAEMVLL